MRSQHTWEATFASDDLGRPVMPPFHRLVMLDLARPPVHEDALRLDLVLRRLERNSPAVGA